MLSQSRRRKNATSYLGSLGQRGRELLIAARDTYVETLESNELPAMQKSLLLHIADIGDADGRNKSDIEVQEIDGALSVLVAKRLLGWLAEAVGRALELSAGIETPKEIAALLRLLLHHLGEVYLETSLEAYVTFSQPLHIL